MKLLKLSLVASLALGALSTASFAQPLEEAIKGVDVSGYLRYRYNDDRYDNRGNVQGVKGGNAAHRWKAVADFRTPVVNNVAFNLGILYNNESQNVNHGKGISGAPDTNGNATIIPYLGSGLGAGKDSEFGVRNFYAVITPDSTATTIIAGKQVLNTPVTNTRDDDRGTGIMVLNSDIPNLTLGVAVFDSWSINDVYNGAAGNETSVDKMLYALAAIYNNDTAFGNIGAQVWGFHIDDTVDSLIFSELSWKGSLFNAKLQYAFSQLADDDKSVFGGLYGFVQNEAGVNVPNIASDNDVLIAEVGADLRADYSLPFDAKLGYITNFQDGTAVSLEDEGAYVSVGKIWYRNAATGFSFSALPASGMKQYGYNKTADVDIFYGALNFGFLEDRFKIGLEGVFGENKIDTPVLNASNVENTIKFREITPTFRWKHSKNLTFSGHYAMLTTEVDTKDVNGNNNPDEDRNRLRLEARYNF